MSTELHAGSGAPAELNAPEAAETPELAAPESTEADGSDPDATEAKEKTPEQKELERLRRLLTKRDRTQGKLYGQLQEAQRALQAQRPPQQEPTTEAGKQPTEAELQRLVEQRADEIARARVEQQGFQQRVQGVISEGQKASPEFDAMCNAVDAEMPFYENGRPTPFLRAVLDADKPAALLAYLGQNPQLLDDLDGLSEGQLNRRLDRLEQQIAKQPPKPAKPLTPVTSKGNPKPKSEADMTDAEWYEARKKK